MACMDDKMVENIICTTGLKPLTEHTITDRTKLISDLLHIREIGYGVAEQEDVEGLRGIGSAIIGANGQPLGGLTVSGLYSHMTDERVKVLGRALAEASAQISAALGYSRGR